MAYKDNWMQHLMASFTGEGGSNKLAQDFWSESLFNPKILVKYHWLKLVWVYCISGITQVTMPTALAMIPITIYKDGGTDWTYALVAIVGVTAISWLVAIFLLQHRGLT